MKQEPDIRLPVLSRLPDAVAIDLDGTLLNSQTQISSRNSIVLEKCLVRGIPVVITTSRATRSVYRLLGAELTNRCSLVVQNGAIGIGAPPLTGHIKEIIPPGVMRAIISTILEMEPEAHLTIELEGYAFGTNRPRQPEELWQINSATPDMQLSLEDALSKEPSKMAVGGLGRDLSHIVQAVSLQFGDVISVVPANNLTFLNITSNKATKSDTLRRLLVSRQLSLDNVIAFGDDIPDVDMMKTCGIPVAVANAVPEVKAVTKYCTASNDEDGVALALEKILNL
jgi:Cof subfamily protein (haloacid dehalogenase superfamily)